MKLFISLLILASANMASAQVYVCKDKELGSRVIEFTGGKDLTEKEFKDFVANAGEDEEYDDFGSYDVLAETTMTVRNSKDSQPTLEVRGVINQADVVFEFIAYDRTARFATYFDEAGGWLTIGDDYISYDDCVRDEE